MTHSAGITNSDHVWVAAATVELDVRQARRAVLRGSIRLPSQRRIDVLETYCGLCRRPYDDVAGQPCVAAETTEHLRGGPIGERKKRKHNHDCELFGCPTGAVVAARQAAAAKDTGPAPDGVVSLTG